MGKEWDRHIRTTDRPGVAERFRGRRTIEEYRGGIAAQLWHQQWAEAAYRVAKPSAYLLAFGGTRTVHRMTCALEDAGWIIRDMLVWGYASGFPKSKASLKPAWEPVVMARKPGPLRMLAIDECRIGTDEIAAHGGGLIGDRTYGMGKGIPPIEAGTNPHLGRWPANIVLTDPIFDGGIEGVVGGGVADAGVAVRRNVGHSPGRFGFASGSEDAEMREDMTYGDTGTYSRFFLVPKSARQDREPVIGHQHRWVVRRYDDGVEDWRCADCGAVGDGRPFSSTRVNIHPTVKPVDLMRHLIRLVTPTGGTVLDPFLGSGTTALAAEMEGFPWIGIEREAEYVAIAEARLNGTQRGMGLGA
jgi:site-specific DNA-methyltransferase (adenine-specific)